MAVLPNTLRDLLNAGKPTIGTHFLFNDPDIAELIGDVGQFDYAEYVAEYSTFDMKTLYHLARAAQCGNLPLMIKLDQASQTFWAQAALGAGFKAVLYTDIRTPEDVDLALQAIRPDKPKTLGIGGHMGVKTRRPALAGYADSYGDDLYDIVTVIMLEKRVALDDIDAILERSAELGVDMTQWGTQRLRLLLRRTARRRGDPRGGGEGDRQVARVRRPPRASRSARSSRRSVTLTWESSTSVSAGTASCSTRDTPLSAAACVNSWIPRKTRTWSPTTSIGSRRTRNRLSIRTRRSSIRTTTSGTGARIARCCATSSTNCWMTRLTSTSARPSSSSAARCTTPTLRPRWRRSARPSSSPASRRKAPADCTASCAPAPASSATRTCCSAQPSARCWMRTWR